MLNRVKSAKDDLKGCNCMEGKLLSFARPLHPRQGARLLQSELRCSISAEVRLQEEKSVQRMVNTMDW